MSKSKAWSLNAGVKSILRIIKSIILISGIILLHSFFCFAEQNKETIDLSFNSKEQSILKFGQINKVNIILKNVSNKALVILEISSITNPNENLITLFGNKYGSVDKLNNEDGYYYNPTTQCPTFMFFYEGFLLPNQKLSISFDYRPISKHELFAVKYISAKNEYDGKAKSLYPFDVYLATDDDRYRHFKEDDWLQIYRSAPELEQVSPYASKRGILIPGLEDKLNTMAQSVIVPVEIELEEKMFTVELACQTTANIIGREIAKNSISYSSIFEGYVIQEKDYSWILKNPNQKNRNELLPLFSLSLIKDIESYGSVRVKVGDQQENSALMGKKAGWKLWENYPVSYGDGKYIHGEFIEIAKAELLDFLRQVYKRGGIITEKYYFIQSRYFVLQIPCVE
ncbi:MAG: hypothetical protein PHV60_04985 [bacterium]|nr:hypothetical protein [bacterium]